MKTQIIIEIGGLILSVLTYFAGVLRTEKRNKEQARKNRIESVVLKYMGLRRIIVYIPSKHGIFWLYISNLIDRKLN